MGHPKGKDKSKLDPYKDDIKKLLSLKVLKTLIADRYNTSIDNLYNLVRLTKIASLLRMQ